MKINKLLTVISLVCAVCSNAQAIKTSKPKIVKSAYTCDSVELASKKQWDEAKKCANLSGDKAAAKLVTWLCIYDGKCEISFDEISRFISDNPNFPDHAVLIKRAEDKISDDTSREKLDKWFTTHKPETGNGIKYYYDLKLPTISKPETLAGAAKYGWIYGNHNIEERKEYLSKYGKYLNTQDHIAKANILLSRGNTKIDSDLLALLPKDYNLLVKARMELMQDHRNFARIIKRVPAHLREDPGLLLSEALWYKHKDNEEGVIDLISKHKNNKYIKMDGWTKIRARAVAELIDQGQYKKAYTIAKDHNYKDSINYVDGEWLAGRVSYIYLNDYQNSLTHFANILNKAKYSVSRSRGAFWAAMSAKKLKNEKQAQEYFAIAAKYPDTFYGQLAITYINDNHNVSLPPDPVPTKEDLEWFKHDTLVRIGKILINKKRYTLAEKFLNAAIAGASTPARTMLIVQTGYSTDRPYFSVTSGKEAIRKGHFLPKHCYPTLKFSPKPDQIEKAFMLAIIRQESMFDHQAVSSAEAMGLMQLIHPTAKDVAKELGIQFKKSDLLNSPRLNLTFGCHHLTKSVENFGNSYLLAAAAYNAGPGNVDKWIKKNGDPSEFTTVEEVVIWIEKIPFYETRGYVQNVLANLQIYRALLKDPKTHSIPIKLDKDLLRR